MIRKVFTCRRPLPDPDLSIASCHFGSICATFNTESRWGWTQNINGMNQWTGWCRHSKEVAMITSDQFWVQCRLTQYVRPSEGVKHRHLLLGKSDFRNQFQCRVSDRLQCPLRTCKGRLRYWHRQTSPTITRSGTADLIALIALNRVCQLPMQKNRRFRPYIQEGRIISTAGIPSYVDFFSHFDHCLRTGRYCPGMLGISSLTFVPGTTKIGYTKSLISREFSDHVMYCICSSQTTRTKCI